MARSSPIWYFPMRRTVLLALGVSASAAFFAACSDGSLAPQAAQSPVELNVPSISFDELQGAPGGASFTVTIDPRRDNVYSDGINSVRFPAGSICDPATSSYGAGTWDQPCAAATAPITLPINVSLRGGRLHLEFGRDLRFAPSADPARHVVLTVANPAVTTTSESLRRFAIFYVPAGTTTLVDEGAADASLVTVVNTTAGTLTRRLKHFSGYNVHLGTWDENCEPGVDAYCYATPPEGYVKPQ